MDLILLNGKEKYEVLSYEQITSDIVKAENKNWYIAEVAGFKFYIGCKAFTKTGNINKMFYNEYLKSVKEFNMIIDYCKQSSIEEYKKIIDFNNLSNKIEKTRLINELKDYLGVKQ